MTTLTLAMTPAQQSIHNSPARFKVVVAGRRFGKTTYAVQKCILEALRTENEQGKRLGTDSEVVYIGTTLEQARRNAWNYFKDFSRPVASKIHENNVCITLVNGVRIRLLGMDNPDAARGMKLRYAVLDEYAQMPDLAFREIIRPALMDTKGGALFIGTPKGRNHFHQLFLEALQGKEDWEAFNFASGDNPTIDRSELDSMVSEYTNGSEDLHEQEILGKFVTKGGKLFNSDDFKISPIEPIEGTWKIAVDLAGFSTEAGKRNSDIKQRDETAIAIVKIHEYGWWVKEIQHGRWGVRETALRIVKAAYDNDIADVGIEKGALFNAVSPYLTEYQNQLHGRWVNIIPLTHGNRHKYDRIQWALQGRTQKGQITLNPGKGSHRAAWVDILLDQAVEFPSRLTHDDLLDSLAYIDQMADVAYFDLNDLPGEYQALDAISGY